VDRIGCRYALKDARMWIEEVAYHCPHCGEPVTALVDRSLPEQDYVEDCEVCCRPIRLVVHVDPERVTVVPEAVQ
jgi:hypothetical protein